MHESILDESPWPRARLAANGGPALLYKTARPKLDSALLATVYAGVAAHVGDIGIGPAEIDVPHPARIGAHKSCPAGFMADLGRIGDLVRPRSSRLCGNSGSIVVCEWAAPHVDTTFAGSAFYSVVLGTGEYPYVVQNLMTRARTSPDGTLVHEVKSCSRVLSPGDAFVLDPSVTHWTAPKYPADGQLLVLLQFELRDRTPEDRADLFRTLPPAPEDQDNAQFL